MIDGFLSDTFEIRRSSGDVGLKNDALLLPSRVIPDFPKGSGNSGTEILLIFETLLEPLEDCCKLDAAVPTLESLTDVLLSVGVVNALAAMLAILIR